MDCENHKNKRQKQSVDGSAHERGGGTLAKEKKKKSLLSGRGMQRPWLSVIPLLLIHFASMFPEVFVALDVQLHKVADFDGVDFSSAAVADLVHSFPEDIFVFILVDVFALIVRFDGKLHLLHCPLLGVQLLQVLIRVFAVIVPSCVTRVPRHP